MMFTAVQDDVCMIMKFLSNSPVTHVAANTHPAVPVPAVITITCNYNFAVNKWNQLTCTSQRCSATYSMYFSVAKKWLILLKKCTVLV